MGVTSPVTQFELFETGVEKPKSKPVPVTRRKSRRRGALDSVRDDMRQIPDGVRHYSKSCVIYTRFVSYPLRSLFAYLREKEAVLQSELQRARGTRFEEVARARLQEVEAHLIWISSNIVAGKEEEKKT